MELLKEKGKLNVKNKLFKFEKTSKGITLVALVVTIIVLIILAGVSINLVLGDNGIITMAKRAKENMELATQEEQIALDNLYMQIDETAAYNKDEKVNAPMLLSGMTPIKFTMPTDSTMGTTITTTTSDADWYEYGTTYETKKWANAQTKDGSMWVWIPRFAYKITYYIDESKTTKSNEVTSYGKIDVVFLIGTTDKYYEEDGSIKTAQRQTSVDQTIDTTTDYTVHPAFTNESNIGYANGGWDKELTGIWVAKFEAGYASGNNSAPVVASNVNYTQTTSWVPNKEAGTSNSNGGVTLTARNWLDGMYAVQNDDNTYSWKDGKETAIKYPTFQGTTYAMNYINHNDAYNIAKSLTNSGNIYGLNNSSADSHLMKNSEWGAATYLGYSKYGQNGTEITTNNANLLSGDRKREATTEKSGVDSVYAVTGCTSNSTETGSITTTIDAINGVSGNTANANGIYTWKQKTGQNASTTGTIYGIYDMSGGTWERTADFISNGNEKILTYEKALLDETRVTANKGSSTKYATIYPHNSIYDNTSIEYNEANLNTANQHNFANNTKIYGDAVRETTSSIAGTTASGWNTSAWNSGYSFFPGLWCPFIVRGGSIWDGSLAGSFVFNRDDGNTLYTDGFRAVLVAK